MPTHLLLAYASKSGWTAEVAERLGQHLRDQGAEVTVSPVADVTSLAGYGAVILGSGVRVGGWLPAAVAFATRYQEELRQLPTALFTVHMLATDDSPESQAKRLAYSAKVRELLAPRTEAFFAGGIALGRLSLMERLMTKAVKAAEGDGRDWDAIAAWARDLPDILSPEEPHP